MQKNRKTRQEPDSDPELDISSLIDVSFLLLIFFLVTSTLLKKESDLGLSLPGKGLGDPEVALEIAIAADGRITVGGEEMAGPAEAGEPAPMKEIRDQLLEHKKRADLIGDTTLVSLRSSGEASTQRFIDVINALAYAGIDHIALAGDLAAN
jgi:biopolymer transport protein ExbD